MEMIQKQLLATQTNQVNQFPRLKFLSNFNLYHGLAKYYTNVQM